MAGLFAVSIILQGKDLAYSQVIFRSYWPYKLLLPAL